MLSVFYETQPIIPKSKGSVSNDPTFCLGVPQGCSYYSEPGRINVSPSTLHYVENYFETEPQGSIEIKNMGSIDMYCLHRIKPEFSDDEEGREAAIDT